MSYIFIFALVAPIICHLTIVDAHHHNRAHFRPGFGGHGSSGSVQIEISAEGSAFKIFGPCSCKRLFKHLWLAGSLKNVSHEALKEFCNIMKNNSLTKAEIEQRLNEWAQKQGGDVQEQLKKYAEQRKQKWNNIQQKMQELIANVSKFISEVEAIKSDMNLTKREEKEKICNLTEATDQTILALAKKIRAEAGTLSGEQGQRPCVGCGLWFPHRPPLFGHHGPRFGPWMHQGGPSFSSGSSGLFGPFGILGLGRYFGINESPEEDELFVEDGGFEDESFGQIGHSGRHWPPFDSKIQRGATLFANDKSGLFGQLRSLGLEEDGSSAQDESSEENGSSRQNRRSGHYWPRFGLRMRRSAMQGGPSGQNVNPPQSGPSEQNRYPPQGEPFEQKVDLPQNGLSDPNDLFDSDESIDVDVDWEAVKMTE